MKRFAGGNPFVESRIKLPGVQPVRRFKNKLPGGQPTKSLGKWVENFATQGHDILLNNWSFGRTIRFGFYSLGHSDVISYFKPMTWAILWFICLFLRKPHPKFHTYFWRPSCPWRPDQVEIKHTSRAALCLYHLNFWCVGSRKHRENFQFHHHRIRIFLTLFILFFKNLSLILAKKN